jgi:hypothetical protein
VSLRRHQPDGWPDSWPRWAVGKSGSVDYYGETMLTHWDRFVILRQAGQGHFRLYCCHYDGTVSRHVDRFDDLEEAAEMMDIVRRQRFIEHAVWETARQKWQVETPVSNYRLFLRRVMH